MDKWAEARGGTVFNMKGPLESTVEETRKRMRCATVTLPLPLTLPLPRLDESGNPMVSVP